MSKTKAFTEISAWNISFIHRILQLRKKTVMLIRIRHTCVALKNKKTYLSLGTSSEINFEFIKFVKIVHCLPLTIR